ncbi:MAG: 5-formyltetrahydrofolate cyclo-ligase [Gammaproteobacteria bacterium]|nr:5-formyltetrahydrofolate cyclo-ligase [Gammaproteobacteria bacterium]MDP2141594.1 5-formyltetrahydrofolate cyclo-ligase [Gammaproteobacteria bacterium]MDP2346651.1 5-formyltetrahydrofolate cyclo-ligase [Gammaproteobacteria bacterium]
MTPQERTALRKNLRNTRRQLTIREQDEAAARLYNSIAGQRFFHSAKRIAFYLPSDGEIDPGFLLAAALARGQHCYLPLIHPCKKNRLLFVRYRSGDVLRSNHWGIYEPVLRSATRISARVLDLVFVPLVGFDAACNRLGMGKGFYDRTFSFRMHTGRHRPMLVGVAHECQKVGKLESSDWDVRMDKIVSDQQTYQPDRI